MTGMAGGCQRGLVRYDPGETALPAWQDTSHLPGKRLADHAPLVERWRKADGKRPD